MHSPSSESTPAVRAIVAVVALNAACLATAGCARDDAFPDKTTSSTASSAASASGSATATASSAAPVASHPPTYVERANLSEDSITVDGLEMAKISCRSKAPLRGDDSILGALSKQKAALDKCTDKTETVRVHFAFDGGKTGDLRVKGASSANVARCIATAIKETTFPDTGACALSLTIGG